MPTYTPPTLNGYNANPPSDNGLKTDQNKLKWGATHIAKIGNPLKNYADAINTAVDAAFTVTDTDIATLQTEKSVSANNSNGNPNISDIQFDITANFGEGAAFDSIGPTASGATNIWTALDSVPVTAVWIEVKMIIRANNASAGIGFQLSARSTGSAAPITEGNIIISEVYTDIPVTGIDVQRLYNAKIQVSANNSFDLSWNNQAAPSNPDGVIMILVGYGGS